MATDINWDWKSTKNNWSGGRIHLTQRNLSQANRTSEFRSRLYASRLDGNRSFNSSIGSGNYNYFFWKEIYHNSSNTANTVDLNKCTGNYDINGKSYQTVGGAASAWKVTHHNGYGARSVKIIAGTASSVKKDTDTPTATTAKGTSFNLGVESKTIALDSIGSATYKITYEANGGSSTPQEQTKTYDVTLTLRGAISRSNYVDTRTITFNANGGTCSTSSLNSTQTTTYSFAGWKASNGTVYSAGASYTANSGTKMTAQWNSSTGSWTSVTLPSASRTGYTFKGWSTSTANAASYIVVSSPRVPSTTPETLYASWQVNQYTLTVIDKCNTNGEELGRGTYSVNYGTSCTPSSYRTTTYTGHTYASQSAAATMGTSGLTLYRYFNANTYKVAYDLKGNAIATGVISQGYDVTKTSTDWTWQGNPKDNNVYYHGTPGYTNGYIYVDYPTLKGYTFNGWTISGMDAGTNHTYWDRATSTSKTVNTASFDPPADTLNFQGLRSTSGTVTFTAKWTPKNYTLTFNANGGTQEAADKTVDTNGNLYCTVTYGSTNYRWVHVPTRPGYEFLGWYTATSGGVKVYDANGSYVAGNYWNSDGQWIYDNDLIVYAQWKAKGGVHIYNGISWDFYQPYIYNGTEWELYEPYIYNGTDWDVYGS